MSYVNETEAVVDGVPCHCDRTKLESPIEEMFIDAFEKYASSKVKVFPQYEIATQSGNFRLDFLIQFGEKKLELSVTAGIFMTTIVMNCAMQSS